MGDKSPKLIPRSRIHFRLFAMPCCGHDYCHVNPRLPNYCPECGKRCYIQLRSEDHTIIMFDGWLCQEAED